MPEERKLVTILFADVTGSTALGESLDPEDVRALMSRYYSHAHQIVSAYGGTLEKFIGDAVMAIFGLSRAHGDDAERALAAALALREAVAHDTVLGTHHFLLRIGVNTGEVVATSDPSSGDFLVTGDTVNVSARLQQAANPGEILVSERTATDTLAAFLFEDSRRIEVKGKRQPLYVFPLTGMRSIRQVSRPPFIGRRQELLQLSVLQARAVEEQRPQVVTIVAPAGTGKTRLLEEFLAHLDPADDFQVATAHCQPYGQTLTYWPLRRLLTELLGKEFDRHQIIATFERGGQKVEEAAHLAGLILATLGIEQESATDRESTFAAWRLLIETLAREAPRILVFEDVHWASDSLLDLVVYTMHLHTQAPVLFIALSRPELLDRRPHWGAGQQNFTSLALQPLAARQMRELVAKLEPGLPEETGERIVERAGGNPFFALELIRGLMQRQSRDKSVPFDELPDTVHAAILARLDLLSPGERAVVQAASVAGRPFRLDMLACVLDSLKGQEVEAALDALQARDLIFPAHEAGSYTFQHMLIRDVAYGMLSRPERIRLHGKIATWLEQDAAGHLDECSELIAYHYREAVILSRQSAVPLALPFALSQAIGSLERAGELASRSGALAEAYQHLQSAIDIAPPSEHRRLYEKLGDNIRFGDTAVNAYRMALEVWRSGGAGDPLIGARLLRKLLLGYLRFRSLLSVWPSTEELLMMRREARQLAEKAGDEEELLSTSGLERLWPYFTESEEMTPEELEEVRSDVLMKADDLEAQGAWADFSVVLEGYIVLSGRVGAYDDALKAALRRLNTPQLPALEHGMALYATVAMYCDLGDFKRSISLVQEALAGIGSGEPVEHLGVAIGTAAWAAWISGHWSELSALLSVLKGVGERLQYAPHMTIMLEDGYETALLLALAREDAGAITAAACVLEHLLEKKSKRHALIKAVVVENFNTLDLSFLEPSLFEADPRYLIILNEYDVALPVDFIARVRAEAGGSEWIKRVVEIAEAHQANDLERLEKTIDAAEAHGLIPYTARMRIILAQRSGKRAPLIQARAVLERLGDRHFLRRLQEVEASLPESNS